MRSTFLRLIRLVLIGRLILIHQQDSRAYGCHTTTIQIQNGTWLNTSRWLLNGFFGNEEYMPMPPIHNNVNQPTTLNPVLPESPFIPNRKQDCLCGATQVLNKQSLEKLKAIRADAQSSFMGLIGGKEFPIRYYPWFARISLHNQKKEEKHCTGVLINARFGRYLFNWGILRFFFQSEIPVLTAATCACGNLPVDCSAAQLEKPSWNFPLGRSAVRPAMSVNVSLGQVEGDNQFIATVTFIFLILKTQFVCFRLVYG